MNKKSSVLVKLTITKEFIKEITKEVNHRIELEAKFRNLEGIDNFDINKQYQNEDNIRNALVNIIVIPIRSDKKRLNPIQLGHYNRLIESLIKQICDDKSEKILLNMSEWGLVKSHWEHDGEKVFGTSVLDGVTAEYFHSKIYPNIEEISKEDIKI